MANFEDYLNDYSLNEESEEQLDPPQVSGGYSEYAPDRYAYSNDGYDNGYDGQGEYADDYASSNGRKNASYADEDEEYGESYDEDYEEEKPARKGFKPGFKMPSFGGGRSEGSASGISFSNGLLTVLVGISLLLSLISVISLGSIKSSVKETRDTLSSQISSLVTATNQLSDRVSAL